MTKQKKKKQSESQPPLRCWDLSPVSLASVKKGVKIAAGQSFSSSYTQQIKFRLGTKDAPRGQQIKRTGAGNDAHNLC